MINSRAGNLNSSLVERSATILRKEWLVWNWRNQRNIKVQFLCHRRELGHKGLKILCMPHSLFWVETRTQGSWHPTQWSWVQGRSWIWPGSWWISRINRVGRTQETDVRAQCGYVVWQKKGNPTTITTRSKGRYRAGGVKVGGGGQGGSVSRHCQRHQRAEATGVCWRSSSAWRKNTKRLWSELPTFLEVRRWDARLYDLGHNPSPYELFASPEAEQDGI